MENYIFQFNDSKALQVQDASICKHLYKEFWTRVEAIDENLNLPKQTISRTILRSRRLHWIPRYASVVIVHSLDSTNSMIFMVGLDAWDYKVHASVHGRESIAVPNVCRPASFRLGRFPTSEVNELLTEFDATLLKSEQDNTGNRRGQAAGHQGNQKTPSFARAILAHTMEKIKATSVHSATTTNMQGGTTDVGQHTGCILRNTSFPLVLCVVRETLRFGGEANDQLFHKCVAAFMLSYLREVDSRVVKYDARGFDRVVTIIRDIKSHLDLLEGNTKFRDTVVAAMKQNHQHLLDLRPGGRDVPPLSVESVADIREKLKPPSFPDIPTSVTCNYDAAQKMQRVRLDAKKNLKWTNIEAPSSNGTLQDSRVQVALSNCFFWDIATQLANRRATQDVDKLQHKLATFLQHVKVVHKESLKSAHEMSVVLKSYELLAVWICCCWAHRVAEENYPLFQQYGAALDPSDLQHVALDDERSIRAAACVRTFLVARQKLVSPFRKHQDTLKLALRVGLSHTPFQRIYKQELERANTLIESRWQTVSTTQRELARLDSQLHTATKERLSAVATFERAEMHDFDYHYDYRGHRSKIYHQSYYDKQNEAERCKGVENGLRSKIKQLEQKPCDVLFGLPRETSRSLQWLFFLFMPKHFRNLCSLAQLAQSGLWQNVPKASVPTQDLHSWFASYKQVTTIHTVESKLRLRSNSGHPRLSTPGIRQYSRETGIFFPDSLSLDPSWTSPDPFTSKRNNEDTTVLFTELLPRNVDQGDFMQKFVTMLPSTARENEGIARREKKPQWLTQEQYIGYTCLRTGPYSQIRNLLHCLTDNLLPFENSCVHVVIKQLLFHIGNDDWKSDLYGDFGGLKLLSEEIGHILDSLRDSPKDCDKLVIFGLVSSFFGQTHKNFKALAMSFAEISRGWAEDVHEEVKHEERVSPAIYWKQAKLFAYAILCHSYGDLNKSELLGLAELIVAYRSKVLFASSEKDSSTLDQPILQVMSSRIDELCLAVRQKVGHLTQCLSLVIDSAPSTLSWTSVAYDSASATACFEAVFSEQLYSINLLNGTVLVDGVPPGLLPNSIVDDPLYVRTFGQRNFETVVLGLSRFKAARLVKNRFMYEFSCDSEDNLHIFESDNRNPKAGKLMLLQRGRLELPPLLRENFSHWYSDRFDVVVVRGSSYQNRCIRYVVSRKNTYEVPVEINVDSAVNLRGSLGDCHRLYLGSTALTDSLAPFEYNEFIHVTLDATETFVHYSLPRYKLSFQQTDQSVWSGEFKNFKMQNPLTLDDTLPGLRAYIVLLGTDGTEKTLISEGTIGNQAAVEIPRSWRTTLIYHIYDVHPRFRYLEAKDTWGRLHLAGLYASNACLVADRRTGKPGMEMAAELLRQSWKNDPLTSAEILKLRQVSGHSDLSCNLRLLCTWLWDCSNSVKFLHDCTPRDDDSTLKQDMLAMDEYEQCSHSSPLLPTEELLVFGTRSTRKLIPSLSNLGESSLMSFVHTTEGRLRDSYMTETRSRKGARKFPLDQPDAAGGIEERIYGEIKDSYRTFCLLRKRECRLPDPTDICDTLEQVTDRRHNLEESILAKIQDENVAQRRLSLMAGCVCPASPLDILRAVSDGSTLLSLNSSLDLHHIRPMCVGWAVLCVLEDKLRRIKDLIDIEDFHGLKTELDCTREWNPCEHPKWLAFEVEQQLQIRPNQYSIVRQLQANPGGSVIQLSMGLGKSRVLVPMLILDLMASDSIPRVNLLPAILSETVDYYRVVVTASILHVPLFSLPYNRGMPLDESHASLLSDEIANCKAQQGCMVVTAQHRNSLLLKQYDSQVFVEGLEESFVDILDESDAILHHDFQLVYALGDQVPLAGGNSRWIVLQALLVVLSRSKTNDVASITDDRQLVHKESTKLGQFSRLRLLLPFAGRERVLALVLARELVTNPPQTLRWIEDVPNGEQEILVTIMSDRSCEDVHTLLCANALFIENQSDILAARGVLCYGLLSHGLQSRYGVNYGLNPSSETKMACPYSAADTPKARAQYSHPDMEIVYTALSYCHQGLELKQLRDALSHLQTMGPVAQKVIYQQWVDSIRNDVDADELQSFDDIAKVDVDNKPLLKLIHQRLGRCMEAIFFWTNTFVYPVDTDQFPSKRATSAWNLCDAKTVGFSGTDDNRYSLPRPITQLAQDEEQLRATNGEMIRMVMDCTKSIEVLQTGYLKDDRSMRKKLTFQSSRQEDDLPLWKTVLQKCVQLGIHALIDVAGLMAGSDTNEITVYLAELFEDQTAFRGIVFFDTDNSMWTVYELQYLRFVPLHSSSCPEADCFVYYDESRCRGSDMKLLTTAVALVTVEPKMTKDKFLQGCARMRKLRPDGQSLILTGTSEVVGPRTTTKDVLEMILANTASMAKKGLLTNFHRGLDFFSFPNEIVDDTSLEAMYGGHISDYADLSQYLDSAYEKEEDTTGNIQELVEYCKDIDGRMSVSVGRLSEECEQELEHEEEFEEQEELELAMENPFAQENWCWSQAFTDPESLFSSYFVKLRDFVRKNLGELSSIKWTDKIFCSPNFCNTIRDSLKWRLFNSMSLYARPVNTMLVLPDGRLALLSGYELDNLLPHWWKVCKRKPKAVLQHLFTAATGKGFGHDSIAIPTNILTRVKLFRGYVQYSERERRALAKILQGIPKRKEVVQRLLSIRSRQGYFDCSDLETVAVKFYHECA